MIHKNNQDYSELSGAMGGTDYKLTCKWMVSEETPSTPTEGQQTSDFDSIPASQLNCKLGVFGPSEFDTPGKACTYDQYMDDLNASMWAAYAQ
jgi:hypothetical protein